MADTKITVFDAATGTPWPVFRAADGREYYVVPVHPKWLELLREEKKRGRKHRLPQQPRRRLSR
jgi:hypothetical protein